MAEKQVLTILSLNLDDDPSAVNPVDHNVWGQGDCRHILNIRTVNSDGENSGVAENIRGNVLVYHDLPGGTNKVIGHAQDKVNNTTIACIYNSRGDHQIIRYYPQAGAFGEIEILAESSVLNFSTDNLIQANVVGDLFYWTDNRNYQRKINLTKARDSKRKDKFNLYLPELTTGITTRDILFTVKLDGIALVTRNLPVTIPYLDTKSEMFRRLSSIWNSEPTISSLFITEACGDFMEIEAINPGNYDIECIAADITPTSSSSIPTWVQPKNKYLNLTNPVLDRIKASPALEPEFSYKQDEKFVSNFIDRNVFQFAVRYLYDDFEKSKKGSISRVAKYSDSCLGTSGANYIEVDFTDPKLSSRDDLCIIEKVQILVREGNTGEFRIAETIEQQDFVFSQKYRFYNDKTGDVLSSDEADPLQDFIPLISKSQTVIQDITSTRLVDGNGVEGYDTPCLDADFDIEIGDETPYSTGTGTVIAKLRIISAHNNYPYKPNQCFHNPGSRHKGGVPGGTNPGIVYGGLGQDFVNGVGVDYGQWAPEGGICMFSAGRSPYAISKQIKASSTSGGDTIYPNLLSNNVYDTSKNGWTILFKNRTYQAAVLECMKDNAIYSDITLTGLEPGEHIIRFADPRCSRGDVLGLGDHFNLDGTSLLWQQTSAPIVGIDGAIVSGRYTEVHITIPPGGGTVDIGTVYMADHTCSDTLYNSYAVRGYLFDNEGDTDSATIRNGTTMENQIVQFVKRSGLVVNPILASPATYFISGPSLLNSWVDDVLVHGRAYTDHNGHFHFSDRDYSLSSGKKVRAACIGATGDPASPVGAILPPTSINNINVINYRILMDFEDGYFEGNLDGALTSGSGDLQDGQRLREFIFYNNNENGVIEHHAAICTNIIGEVRSVTGDAIPGLLVMHERTGRSDTTDSSGRFSIKVWADAVRNLNDRADNVLIAYEGTCTVTLGSPVTYVVVNSFEPGQDYSIGNPYDMGTLLASILVPDATTYLKRGGKYWMGIVYKERGGRITTVGATKDSEIYIPFYTEDLNTIDPVKYPVAGTFKFGRPSVRWTLNHDVPIPNVSRFTHYQWVIAPYQFFAMQWVVNQVEYVARYDDGTGAPVTVTYSSSTAKEIYLSLQNILYYAEENTDSMVAYTYETGDRVRIITSDATTPLTEFIDLPIKGVRDNKIIIENLESLPELTTGAMIEICTPKQNTDNQIFYEAGEVFTINDPYGTPTHSITSGTFDFGDIHYIPRDIPTRHPTDPPARFKIFAESYSASDFYQSEASDFGRPNIYDPTATQYRFFERIRHSDPIVQGTKINGLSSFGGLNYADHNRLHGPINWMGIIGDVLLVAHAFKLVSRYPGQAVTRTGDGGALRSESDMVLGMMRELAGDHGCQNAESIDINDMYAYGFDLHNGIFWRYSTNGVYRISDYKIKNFTSKLARSLRNIPENNRRVYGVIDKYNDEYVVSVEGVTLVADPYFRTPADSGSDVGVPNPSVITGFTFSFHENLNRWTSFYSFLPEFMGRIGNEILTYKNGALWLHNRSSVYNNFYGVQYNSEAEVVANMIPELRKAWRFVEEVSDEIWEIPEITNEVGQSSKLVEANFETREFDHYSGFWKDETTPIPNALFEGRELRSKTLRMLLRNNSTALTLFRSISVYFTDSSKSQR